ASTSFSIPLSNFSPCRMNLLLCFSSLLAVVYAHGSCPGGDCLAACRACGELINDGPEWQNKSSVFDYGCHDSGDCKEAVCKEKGAVMIIDGHDYKGVVCFQGKWHFGYPHFLEETNSAECRTPGNETCTDPNASITYTDGDFDCVCNPPYKDRTEEFSDFEPNQVCSNCENKKLNIILLADVSGSMNSVKGGFEKFINVFVQFLKINNIGGNRVALVTSSWSYEIVVNWREQGSTDADKFQQLLHDVDVAGQSYLGTGMEAVKAALVQPYPNDTRDNKLIVFTDGSVKHSPPFIKDISVAANNLEALGVETFVVVSNNEHAEKANAIANGVEENVFTVVDRDPKKIFEFVHKLQQKVCA
ncbi:hypothetical protein PENTCL1PPCAC_28311, partial [Pristionchus entomophagus]